MASENKKRKLKNSYMYKTELKAKGKGIKRISFFTPSERKVQNSNTAKMLYER